MMSKLAKTALVTVTLFCTTVLFSPQVRAEQAPDTVVLTPAEQQQLDFMHQPEAWFVEHLKGPREVSDGGVLDARLQYVLENVTRPAAVMQPAIRAAYQTPEGRANGRKALDRYWLIRTAPSAAMKSVDDRVVKGRDGNDIPVRVYHPDVAGKLPVMVYYHGGGFMFGSIEGWDRTAREIANASKMIVVSVGYRLAPEHPYPAAWNDAEDSFAWVVANVASLGGDGVKKVYAAGDSAGGTLAISVALRALHNHKPGPQGLLLYYPGVDRENDYPSMHELGTGYGLDADNLKYLADQVYPAGVATTADDTSPMQADLCGIPFVYMVTAGFDPLKDSQMAFQRKGAATFGALAPTLFVHVTDHSLIHGFLQTTGYVDEAKGSGPGAAAAFGNMVRKVPKPSKTCGAPR